MSFIYLPKSCRVVCQYRYYPFAYSVSNAIESVSLSLLFTYYFTPLFNHKILFTNYLNVVNLVMNFLFPHNTYVAPNSSVGIATG
jgi:hypothetical protein